MPFNPFLDTDGDGTWTDLEADTDSLHGASPPHLESSASPSPRLRAQIIELSEESDVEDDAADLPSTVLNKSEAIAAGLQEDTNHVQPGNSKVVRETTRETENLEHVNLLTEFMRDPTKSDGGNDDSKAGRGNLRPSENTFGNSEVGQAARVEATNLNCEFCLKSHRRCDGVKPVCGRCGKRRRECIWPSVRLSRADFHRIERARHASSSATPSPNHTKSNAHKDSMSSRTIAEGESAATTFFTDMERTLNQMAEGDVGPNHEPRRNKDLVFSDVLPEAENQSDPEGRRDGLASKTRRTVQCLDLCDSDSATTPPPRDNSCHHCVVGKRKTCNGERPCQSCFKYGWRCFDPDPKLRKEFRPRKRKSELSQARRVNASSKPPPIKSNTRYEADETSHEKDSDISWSEHAQPRHTAASATHSKYHPQPYDEHLIRGKRQGLTSNQIKEQMNLQESASTLRGRWRLLVQWGVVEPMSNFHWKLSNPHAAEAPVVDNIARIVSVQGAQGARDSSTGLPRQLPFDCRSCIVNRRYCNRRLPCTACLDHGQSEKCWFKGGRGGGGGTAKHLYKAPEQASPSVQSIDGPIATQLTKVRMINADQSDTRTVYCNQCIKCHSTCDTMLPCDRCELRGIGHLCSYSDRYVPVLGASVVANGTPLDEVAPAISRSLPASSAQIPAKGIKIRMVNADPKETRVVFCDACTKCHQICDANLPCSRCEANGHQCSYSKRYVPAASENGSTSLTDSGYSTLSPITSALPVEPKPNGTPSKSQGQPITRNIISDSESDDEILADIVHEEESTQKDTVQVSRSNRPTPTMRDSVVQLLKTRDGGWTLNIHKRKASPLSTHPLVDIQQPPQKRARRGSEEALWRPSGGTRGTLRRSHDRPITRLTTSAVERRSYAKSPTAAPHGGDEQDDYDTVHPREVPSTVREVFANMPKDMFLDIFPASFGRGARPLGRMRSTTKQPDEYSTSALAVRIRERRADMSDLETILTLRERADSNAMRRVMKAVENDPLIRWKNLSQAQQEELRENKHKALMEQRDEDGRSADSYANKLLKLATSCVGETAMLQFLMQSRKARLKVIGLFDDLVSLEEDGRLRIKAGQRGVAEDGVGSQSDFQRPSTHHQEHDSGPSSLHCEWQGCARRFNAIGDLDDHLCNGHLGSKVEGPLPYVCKWGSCTFGAANRGHILPHVRTHLADVTPLFECHVCGQACKTAHGLKRHLGTHDEEEDEYWDAESEVQRQSFPPEGAAGVSRCKWLGCSRSFTTSESLFEHLCEDHVGYKATGNSSLRCHWDDCNYSASFKRSHMTQHMLSHARFKPFRCKVCGRGFRYNWEINKHAAVHGAEDEEGEIRLSDWGARSTPKMSKEPLYRSVSDDTVDDDDDEEGAFTCQVCGRHCTNAQGLGKHMTTHEP